MAFFAWCFPEVGPYHTFLGSTVGFLYEPLGPTVGQLHTHTHKKRRDKKDKCSKKCSGRWVWLKLTELLKRGCVRRSRGTLEGGWIWAFFITRSARRIRSTVLNWPELNKWRQKFSHWQHSRSRGFKWFNWKWLLLIRNELSLIKETVQRGESLIVFPSTPLIRSPHNLLHFSPNWNGAFQERAGPGGPECFTTYRLLKCCW